MTVTVAGDGLPASLNAKMLSYSINFRLACVDGQQFHFFQARSGAARMYMCAHA
jgi:hypothetical protein